MALNKFVPYTDEQSEEIITRYQAGETVEQIAQSIDRSARSVIAKLSREGVYISKTKPGQARATKAALVEGVAEKLGLDLQVVETLEKATHEALQALHDAVEQHCSVA